VPAIRCENLTKCYGSVTALNGLTIDVVENSIFGFLGPNGAGKTTTVKLLMGMSRPSAGRAWVNNEEVVPDSPRMRFGMGYLPDVPNFYNWMTGIEFLLFTGELFQLTYDENKRRASELIDIVGLSGAGGRRIGGYSRGMKQRLGLAQALVNRPKVLFLDEPCSALDPLGRRDVLNLITELKKNTTVFMSTHILSDAERVCDSLAVVNKGSLIAVSTVEELRKRFALSSFELEFDNDTADFVKTLEQQPWVLKIERYENNSLLGLRLNVSDVSKAKHELPRLIAERHLSLVRYEMSMPKLEDIFAKLVEGGAQ